jgi:hypothetical protein
VIGISKGARVSPQMFAAVAAAAAAVGLAACSVSGGTPAASVTHTVTAPASQPSPAGPATAPASPAAPGSGGTSAGTDASAAGKLPDYQPSTVVSSSASSTVLTSPDSVQKIGAFYSGALAKGGWHVTSSSTGPYHASFTADRSGEGASISVYPRAGGSGISISTHPM